MLRPHESCLPESVTQVMRAMFAHTGLSGRKLTRLIDIGVNASIGDQLFWGRKTVDIANLCQDDGPSDGTNSRDRSDVLWQ